MLILENQCTLSTLKCGSVTQGKHKLETKDRTESSAYKILEDWHNEKRPMKLRVLDQTGKLGVGEAHFTIHTRKT